MAKMAGDLLGCEPPCAASHSPVLDLVGCSMASRCLSEAASILSAKPDSAVVLAFRSIFATGPDCSELVEEVWDVLLPGVAELWFRVVHRFVNQYPTRLLYLIHPDYETSRDKIAHDFLTCPACCLDSGFSRVLRRLCRRRLTQLQDQIAFMRSPWLAAVFEAWPAVFSTAISGIERFHATIW